jgi:glucose-1-phosphate adenylyltransferase
VARTIAMILAGGRVDDLSVLTLKRPKSAVPFGGIYRIIDFPLTNLMRSGIDQIGILSQYRLGSLMDHVGLGGPWDLQGRRRGVRILPPYLMAGGSADWYRGTADAVFQNRDFMTSHRPDNVMVLSGDHVYRMDYRPLLRFHEESKADLTMVFKPVDPAHASRFGIATMDADNRLTSYEEKPKKPRGNLASLTIYVFRAEALFERIDANAKKGKSFHFYEDIIPRMVKEKKVRGYVFDGYWEYSRTIDEYYRASMGLVAEPTPIDLAEWQIRTNPDTNPGGELVPARFLKGSKVASSIVPGGCVIEGEVSASVLSPKVHIGKGARVSRSILMDGVHIGEGAVVEGAILDKHVKVGAGAVIGVGNAKTANKEIPHSLSTGITVVGRDTQLPAKAKVGTNCLIHPDLKGLKGAVKDGGTVR